MQKRNYKELFQAGNKAQLEQMEKHEYKRGWKNFLLHSSFQGIRKSAIHIESALYKSFTHQEIIIEPTDLKMIRKKAANIANFAHMIILKCDKEIENAKNS